jgi:hypothetical protein
MCCQRFPADVLLANVFGSSRYKENQVIPVYDFLKKYCRHLNTILSGSNFFEISENDIESCAARYKGILEWVDDSKEYLMAHRDEQKRMLNRDVFNQPYSEITDKKLKITADSLLDNFFSSGAENDAQEQKRGA